MPKRRRKSKSPASGEPAVEITSSSPPSEPPTDTSTASSAPKKKAARRRRKKKPDAAQAAAEQKPPAPKPRVPTSGDRRAKEQRPPRKPQGRKTLEPEAPETPIPIHGRRTGLGTSGQPRKGRSAASLAPPEPAGPIRSGRPTSAKPTPTTRIEFRPSSAARPQRSLSYAQLSDDDDDDVPLTPPPSTQREERDKHKQPVSGPEPAASKAIAKDPERASLPPKSSHDRKSEPEKPDAVAEPRKKRRRRRRKPGGDQAVAPPAETALAQPAPADAEPTPQAAEEVLKPEKRRRRGRKPGAAQPVAPRTASPAAEVAPVDAEPIPDAVKELAEPEKRRQKKSPEREKRQLPPFGDLVLSDEMLEALDEARYQEPTPVQAGLIPKALEGRDLMGQAQTGTGKTAAFGIPLLEKFGSGEKRNDTAALILVPTRELAVQVRDELTKLAGRRKVTTVAVYGGKPIRGQIDHLRRGAEIVVGTPGRVIDLIDRRALNLGSLECVVLDEADRMLDIGFRPDIEKILRRCPQSRQTLLLSATIPPPVKRLAERYMHDPEMLDFSPKDVAVETIEQFYFTVDPRQKFDLLMKLIEREDPKQAIIFCRTKKGTDRVGTRLARKLKQTAMIHGDLQQRQRDRVMADFRAGLVRFLVATDVVGRGIDVSGISHIINFDIPEFCDDYIHRVGRTGRMGREGVAYTFVSPEEGNELTRIEMRINRLLIRDEMPGFLAVPRPEPTPEAETPEAEPSKPKSVFGQRTRRIRRAL